MLNSRIMHTLNVTASAILVGLSLFSLVGTAQATILEIDFSKSGLLSGTAPSLPVNPATPFAKAFFNDHGGSGSATLTMYVNNLLPGSAYVNGWYFNSNTAPLSSISWATGDVATAVGNSTNAYKADGTGGDFDFAFIFPAPQIAQGLYSVYTLTDVGLTADAFNSLSVADPTAGGGGYVGALHVTGYGSNSQLQSWFSGTLVSPVPEPKTYAMLLAGLGLVGFSARRRKNFAA